MGLTSGLALFVLAAPAALADGPTIGFSSGDPEMNAAITAARATLDHFIALYEAQQIDTDSASLKVGVPTTEGFCCEHLWMSRFTRDGAAFTAIVGNEPVDADYLTAGQSYQFTRASISDWSYIDDGRIHGAYTLRAMLPHLDADRAAQLRKVLVPLP